MSAPGQFSFIVLNDLHYTEQACRPWLEGLVRQVNATPDVALVLVAGDLTETGSREELLAARDILNQLRAPYYTVPGNHDGPPGRLPGLGDAGLTTYNELFPGRRNYSFVHKQWQFLALDTTDGSGYQNLPFTAETRAFAQQAARILDPHLPTILFTHFPLDPTVKYCLAKGYELLEILRPLNLRIVFGAHYHGLTENVSPHNPDLKLLTNRCCARARELHENTTLRGYFRSKARADTNVDYAFVEYHGP